VARAPHRRTCAHRISIHLRIESACRAPRNASGAPARRRRTLTPTEVDMVIVATGSWRLQLRVVRIQWQRRRKRDGCRWRLWGRGRGGRLAGGEVGSQLGSEVLRPESCARQARVAPRKVRPSPSLLGAFLATATPQTHVYPHLTLDRYHNKSKSHQTVRRRAAQITTTPAKST
jgi:hypothetical protein